MAENPDVAVLNSIYRGAKTGEQAINDMLPKTDDRAFTADLETQRDEYVTISKEAATRLVNMGTEPEPVGEMKKLGMKVGVTMNTMTNDETNHLAELVIKGSNMGIITMTKVVNGYQQASPETLGLAQKLITTENDNITRLKTYLK
ncbi:MAG: hypothetical protein ACI3VB_01070 [Oscillospiraceae bacterium]